MPVVLQLVGPPHRDAVLLGAAALVEQTLGFRLRQFPT
jgi:Asp-tRNA(Asn)/Glu-tRNA(Gln) amidotransferase A subunit family amidase